MGCANQSNTETSKATPTKIHSLVSSGISDASNSVKMRTRIQSLIAKYKVDCDSDSDDDYRAQDKRDWGKNMLLIENDTDSIKAVIDVL